MGLLAILLGCVGDGPDAFVQPGSASSTTVRDLPALDGLPSVECSRPPDDAVIMRTLEPTMSRYFYGPPEPPLVKMFWYLQSWQGHEPIVVYFTEPTEVYSQVGLGFHTLDLMTIQGEWRYFDGDPWFGWSNYYHHFQHTFNERVPGSQSIKLSNYLNCSWSNKDEADCFVPTQYCFSHVRSDRLTGTYLARFADAPDVYAGNVDYADGHVTPYNFFLVFDIPDAAMLTYDVERPYNARSIRRGPWVANLYYRITEDEVWPDPDGSRDSGEGR